MTSKLSVPVAEATDGQLLRAMYERLVAMSEQSARLQAAVEQELADDAAQNELIAQQRALIDELRAAVDAAVAAGAADRDGLAAAYAVMDDAAARLESNDPALDPEPEPAPEG